MRHAATGLALVLLAVVAAPAAAQEKYERNDKGEWTYERKDGRREIKEERKLDQHVSEYKDGRREVKREAKADGSWKEEIKTGRCVVKRERGADGAYKEERSC